MDIIDYDALEHEETPFAKRLAYWIKEVINPIDVLDIGCGPGMHVRELNVLGVEANGIDSDERVIGKPNLSQISIFDNKRKADTVICLEVAEHIDKKYENEVAAAVAEATETFLIWTAAAPGQGGVGHINCQPTWHWEKLLIQNGLVRNSLLEKSLKLYIKEGYHMGWFANNLLLMERT